MHVQQLAEVARASVGAIEAPPMEKLLACVRNIRQVALLLQQPGRRFKGPAGPEAAATYIQAHWRSATLCQVQACMQKLALCCESLLNAKSSGEYTHAVLCATHQCMLLCDAFSC